MKRKLLFLEDLYDVFIKNQIHTFNAKSDNDGQPLYVQTHGHISFSEDAKENLLFVNLKACHCGENLNHSFISQENMEHALPSLPDRPILGFLHQVDGQWEFYGHNMEIDKDGNVEYQEIPVGHFPQNCNPTLVYDEEEKKTYVHAMGVVYEDYTHAADVLRREQECAVSVELAIRDLNYSQEDGLLHINDFIFSGCTILGKDDNGKAVNPGMQGANVTLSLEDFSKENNSIFSHNIEDKLLQTLDQLNQTLAKFDINNLQRKEANSQMDKLIQELMHKYSITQDQIDFSIEGLDEEAVTALFAEKFGTQDPEPNPSFALSGQIVDGLIEALGVEKIETEYGSYSKYSYVDYDSEVSEVYAYSRDDWKLYGFNYTVSGDAISVDFDSMKRKKFSIVDFIDGEDGDTSLFSLVHPVLESAIATTKEADKLAYEQQIQDIKNSFSDYEDLKAFKETQTLEMEKAAREKILADDSYFEIRDTDEFKTLVEKAEQYSSAELADEADKLLLQHSKAQALAAAAEHFSVNPNRQVRVQSKAKEEPKNPYGTLFDDCELK